MKTADCLRNVKSIAVGSQQGILLNKAGKDKHWENECSGKAAGVSKEGTFKSIWNADRILCSEMSVYVVKDNSVIKLDFKR